MTGNKSWGGGAGDHTPSQQGGGGRRQRRVSNDPDVVQVITKDLIRKIKYVQRFSTVCIM